MKRLSHSYCYLLGNCTQWEDWQENVKQLSINTIMLTPPNSKTRDHKKCLLVCLFECCYICVCVCVCIAVVPVHPMYLFVCVVVGIYVVVKLLVSEVLLLTQLTVEKSLQILHWAAQSPLCTLLERDRDGKNEWEHWRDRGGGKEWRIVSHLE